MASDMKGKALPFGLGVLAGFGIAVGIGFYSMSKMDKGKSFLPIDMSNTGFPKYPTTIPKELPACGCSKLAGGLLKKRTTALF
jgi:hypothetical protein